MDGRNIPVYLHLHSLQSSSSTISTLLWAPLTNWLTICTGCRVTWISVLIIWFPFVNLFTALFNCNWGLGLRLKVNHVHFTLVGWLVGQWNAVYSQCRDEEADEGEKWIFKSKKHFWRTFKNKDILLAIKMVIHRHLWNIKTLNYIRTPHYQSLNDSLATRHNKFTEGGYTSVVSVVVVWNLLPLADCLGSVLFCCWRRN